MRLFKETEVVHNALIQQLVKAIEPMYLKQLCNPITNQFSISLCDIPQHLTKTYGNLTVKWLQAKEQDVTEMTYNNTLPVDVVFTPIDDYTDISKVAGVPKSEAQKIQLPYLIFQKCGKFKSDLKNWNNK